MADTESTARSNVMLISVLSGLAGAGLALLLAPRSGRETRGKLQTSANDLKQEVRDEFGYFKSSAEAKANAARDAAHRLESVLKTHKDQLVEELKTERRRASNTDNNPSPSVWKEEEY